MNKCEYTLLCFRLSRGDIMNRIAKTLIGIVFALAQTLAFVSTGLAETSNRIYDASAKKWIEYGPHMRYGKSKIERELIDYEGPHAADTIVVDTAERRLYYVLGDTAAGHAQTRTKPAGVHGGRHQQSAGCPCALYRIDDLQDPRIERALDNWLRRLVGVHPNDER